MPHATVYWSSTRIWCSWPAAFAACGGGARETATQCRRHIAKKPYVEDMLHSSHSHWLPPALEQAHTYKRGWKQGEGP